MTPEFKQKLKDEFVKMTNREPNERELGNMETDYLLVQKVILQELENIKNKLK